MITKTIAKKILIYEEQVKIAEGKRFPDISASGEYVAKAGNDTSFKENWYYGVRFTIPIFDGGLIRSEINKEKVAMPVGQRGTFLTKRNNLLIFISGINEIPDV